MRGVRAPIADLQVEARSLEPVAPLQTLIQPRRGLDSPNLQELWEHRELLYFLVWRDVKVRYKQTLLGVLWVLLQPLLTTGVFTVLFGLLLRVPTGGVPYPLFALSGLLPWNYFASSITRSSTSVVGNAHLVTKVYFPRLVIPLTGVLSSLVDLGVAALFFLVLMFVFRITPTLALLALPAIILLALVTALGFGLWLSALNVRFRDVTYLLPFLVRIWMYVTPVVYGSSLIPERFRFLLSLNPMTAVVEGFRWATLGVAPGDGRQMGPLLALSVAIALGVFISGIVFFRSTERSFADII